MKIISLLVFLIIFATASILSQEYYEPSTPKPPFNPYNHIAHVIDRGIARHDTENIIATT